MIENTSSSHPSNIPRDLAEYNTLRQEVLERIKLRQQIIAATLILSAGLLSVGINLPTVALIYPPLAAFLALAWAQNDYRVRDLSKYIQEFFECDSTRFGWEYYMEGQRNQSGPGAFRVVVAAHGGLFLVTQFIAVGLGVASLADEMQLPWGTISFPWITMSAVLVGLLSVDIISILVVIWVIYHAKR